MVYMAADGKSLDTLRSCSQYTFDSLFGTQHLEI